jgi:hypothetical protein
VKERGKRKIEERGERDREKRERKRKIGKD